MLRVLGIDPGKGGALVVITGEPHQEPHLEAALEMPSIGDDIDAREVASWIRTRPLLNAVWLERAQAFPARPGFKGPGASSTFAYGEGYGKLKAVLEVLEIPFQVVHPRVWFGAVNTSLNKGGALDPKAKKELTRLSMSRRIPGSIDRICARGPRGGVNYGFVDATAIALYGLWQELGVQAAGEEAGKA